MLKENPLGYSIRNQQGEISIKKFINALDYSLDLIKLREVYEKVYRRVNFSFNRDNKEYTQQVINVTFKYANRAYNRCRTGMYIKQGWSQFDIDMIDNICVINGDLIAIQTEVQIEKNPVGDDILGSYFRYNAEKNVYEVKSNIPVTHTTSELREWVYKNGFICDGIKYVRYKRSSGSSRVGKCLFINERLYPRMHKWEMCGLSVKEGDKVDLAGLESYISLTLSSIIDTIEIHPENILVIDDYESTFIDSCASVTYDGFHLRSEIANVNISNSIWDGQSLLDVSVFGDYARYGMILLRNRFFKSCCFNTNLKEFFTDMGITEVSQLKGYTLATSISDIKLITTPSSIKYLKFGSLKEWLKRLDPIFGLVKHEKRTHFFNGRMVQTHYQLLNSLQMSQEEVDDFLKPSLDYLDLIRTDPAVLRYHIKYHMNESDNIDASPMYTKNDVIYRMLGITDKFADTKMYNDFKNDVAKAFIKDLRKGHVLVDGNYSTLFGNPYEMLLSCIGEFDGTSSIPKGHVLNYRFKDGEKLVCSRSPHICAAAVMLATNMRNRNISRYFNLSKEIICINSIGENILQQLSGADFDSDSIMITNNPILVTAAERNSGKFPIPTNFVESRKTARYYTAKQKADLDVKTSVNKIGEIVNLSQELNSLLWDKLNKGADFEDVIPLYLDISTLSAMSGIEIDMAKREYPVNNTIELDLIKSKYQRKDEQGRIIKPNFLGRIEKYKGYYDSNRKCYQFHLTSMDFVQRRLNRIKNKRLIQKVSPLASILIPAKINYSSVRYDQVNRILSYARTTKKQIQEVWSKASIPIEMKVSLSKEYREACVRYIAQIKMNTNTMYMLMLSTTEEKHKDIYQFLISMLYENPESGLYNLLQESNERQLTLVEGEGSDIQIYNLLFGKK